MGRAIVAGGKPAMEGPSGSILVSELAVGSSVYLMENGTAMEYLVVNHGIPRGSSLYDVSCNGTWLVRKDIYENRQFNSSDNNSYKESTIHTYLNKTFFNLFGNAERTAIKQVKIPYVNGLGGSDVASGANGLTTKVFLLGGYEVGFTTSDWDSFQIDGAKLDYFDNGNQSNSAARSKRIAKFNGSASEWYLRSPVNYDTAQPFTIINTGNFGYCLCTISKGIRPALVLSSTAMFDAETMILKGVT